MALTFSNPDYLWFLLAIPVLILAHFISLRFINQKALKFANFKAIERITGSRILSKNMTLLSIRLFSLALIILAISGTSLTYRGLTSNSDFVLAIDSSSSMLTTDYKPNRLEAAKEAAKLFVDTTPSNTKIGIVSFAGTSFVDLKSNNDHTKVKEVIENVQVKAIGGTDLGEAIVTSANLLTTSQNSKVIILLTDGRSNVGNIISESISYANSNNIIIHTVGMGTIKGDLLQGTDILLTLDEETLRKIADLTSGTYSRADNVDGLRSSFINIASLTESKKAIELSLPFIIVALLLLILEWTLINTRYRTLP